MNANDITENLKTIERALKQLAPTIRVTSEGIGEKEKKWILISSGGNGLFTDPEMSALGRLGIESAGKFAQVHFPVDIRYRAELARKILILAETEAEAEAQTKTQTQTQTQKIKMVSIRISELTRERLKELKKTKYETYDGIIQMLIG